MYIFLFCVMAWFIAFTLGMCKTLISTRGKFTQAALIIGVSAIFSIIVWFCMVLTGVCRKVTRDNFTFEVSPAKQCCLGPYMTTSNPEKEKMCSKVTKDEKSKSCCSRGYNGRPISFEYTPLSNSNWENERCDKSN